MATTMLDYLRFYTQQLGWSVLPVAAKGKVPTKAEWPIIATTDMTTVQSWLDNDPLMNVGVLCGQASGIIVLDVDPESGGDESLLALIAQYGKLPNTVECITGGGGRHIYFAHPGVRVGNSTGSRSPLGPGLDIRGDGGFVVVPPSLHSSDNYYEWEPSCKPSSTAVAPMPGWMVTLLTQRQTVSAPPVPDAITEGARNDMLASLAGTMRRRGMGYDAIYAALQMENDDKCDPPLSDKEVKGIAKSVSRYAPQEMGLGLAPATSGNNNGGDSTATKQEFREPMDARTSVMKFIDLLGDLEGRSIPTYIAPVDASLGGLERKTLTVIAARPSMGKSTLAWQVALNVSASGMKVYFFSLEMSAESLWAKTACGAVGVRWKDIRAGAVPQDVVRQVIDKANELAERHADTLLIDDGTNTSQNIWNGVEYYKPDLVIVDHLRLVSDKDEGREDQRLGMITQRLKDMAKQFNCVVICLAQLNRSVEARDNKRPHMSDLRDSGQVEENADLILTMYRKDYYDDIAAPPLISATELLVRKFRDDIGRQQIMLGFDTVHQWFDKLVTPAQRVMAGQNGSGKVDQYGRR